MSARRPGSVLRLVIVALVLAVLGGAAWVAFSGVLGPDRLRAELQRAALRATGRELTIDGPVHIGLGLSPSLVVERVALANLPGTSRPQMITAERVSAQLALLPLLAGDLVFEQVSVQSPDILLERAPDGTANWVFAAPKRSLYQAPDTGTRTGGDGGGETEIHDIRVSGGQILWRPVIGPGTTLTIQTAHLAADSATGPMAMSLHGAVQGVGVSLKVAAGSFDRLRGGPTTALSTSWPLMLDAEGDWGNLHVEGGFSHPDQVRAYDFRATANVPDMALLRPAFPALNLPPLREVNFTTRLTDGTSGELRTAGLSLHAGQSDLGSLAPGLSIKEATVSAPGPGQQVQVTVDGTYQGTVLRIAGTAVQPDSLAMNTPVPLSFTAQIASATMSVRGTIPPVLGGNGLDITASARVPDLADLAPLTGRSLPPAKDIVFDAKIGDAGYRLRGIALRDLVLNSSLGDVAGTLSVAWAPIIDVRGTLTSKILDLDKLGFAPGVSAPAVAMPEAAPQQAAAGLPDVQLPMAALRGADADVSVTFNNVVLGGENLRDFQARLQASNGRLALNPFRVTSPAGVVIGGATIDASTDDPPVAVNVRSPSLSAAALMAVLGRPGAASGPLQVDAALSGVGASSKALLATLSGHLGLSMVNGTVSDAFLAGLLGNALGGVGLAGAGDGTSQVRCFATRADFVDGHGSFRALALDTSRLSMDGDGQFDLGSETLNVHLRPKLLVAGTEASAPVSVKGSFAAPRVALDPVLGGRVGFSIGGAPGGSACGAALRVARGGMAGPVPVAAASADAAAPGQKKKPVDLLRGLFHH